MKQSKYNICLPYDDRFVIFNGVTKRFFLVSSQNKEAFLRILSTPDEYKEQYAPFLKQMAGEGFIIEDDVDELEVIKLQYHDLTHGNSYKLMILPTYACNVSCWYCTQNHRNMQLSDDDVERVKKHIAYYLPHNDIKRFQLAWFGGEPLLSFHRVEEIASFAKTFCQEHSISYHNTITTNGTLLSRRILEKMKDLDFTFFQITVDGTKNEHDKVKVIKGKSAYEMTLRNICLISEILPDAEICLRYNYTTDNLEPDAFIMDLEHYLPESVRKRINLSIMKVWQEDEKNIDGQELETLVTSASDALFNVSVGQGFYPCYVDNIHFNSVFPNGRIGKCDNLDPDSAQGHLAETGEIVWDKEIPAMQFTVFDDHESECLSCQYLPICNGPCPKERDQACLRKEHLKCRFQDADRLWNQNILYYCRRFLHLLLLIIIPYIVYAQTDSTKVAAKDSIYKNVDLKNVVVTGKNVTHYPDKDVWLITDSLRKETFSVSELTAKLPGFIYDPFKRTTTFQGSSKILFLLDGKEKRANYVEELGNIRFEKIEVLSHPTGKYENYDVVINMITKENWRGYDINLFNMDHAQPSAPYGSLITMANANGTYTYVMPKYDVAVYYGFSHNNSHKKYDYYEKTASYEERSIDNDRPTSISFSNMHRLWIDMGYNLSKDHTLSFVYSINGSHSNNYNPKSVERNYWDRNKDAIIEYGKAHDANQDYSLSLNYKGIIKDWTLSSELTLEKYQSDQSSIYSENGIKLFDTPYDNSKDYFYYNIDAVKRFKKKATFNVGYTNVFKGYDSKSGESISGSKEYRNILYSSLSYSFTKYWGARFGGIYRHIKRNYHSFNNDSQDILSCDVRFYYKRFPNCNLEFSYSNRFSSPTQKQINTNGQWVNNEVYSVGNPNLKASTTHWFSIHSYYKPFSLDVRYDYTGNGICQMYREVNNTTTISYENIKEGHLSSRISANHFLPLWGGTLTMNAMIGYEWYYYKFMETKVKTGFWTGVASVNYRKGKLPTIGLAYNNFAHEMKTLQSRSISGPDTWMLSLSYMMYKNRLIATLNYTLPIAFDNKWYSILTSTPFYEKNSSYYAFDYVKNTFNLSIIYRFAKGRQSYRQRTKQNIEVEQ